MKNIFLFLSLTLLFVACSSSKTGSQKDNLLVTHSFDKLDELMEKEPRNIAIFIHTDWCKFCKNMQQTTLKNEKIVKLLTDEYYFISFDGEQKETITFGGKEFEYKPSGRHYGTHELAMSLGTIENELAYPIFVILNPEREITFQYASFLNSESMYEVLTKSMD